MSNLIDEKWGAERDASEKIVRRERGCGKLKSTEKRLMNKHRKYSIAGIGAIDLDGFASIFRVAFFFFSYENY